MARRLRAIKAFRPASGWRRYSEAATMYRIFPMSLDACISIG